MPMKMGRARERAMLRRRDDTSGLIWRARLGYRRGWRDGEEGEGGGGVGTPVVERNRERRRGELKHTATLEKAVMMTAVARSPPQLQDEGF